MSVRSRFAAVIAIWATLFCTSVRADESAHDSYETLIGQAVVEYEARNFAEARALFEGAHAMFPNARTLRGLGMMEFELRNYADSISRLEAALASKVKPLDGSMRAQTEALLDRARAFMATVELQTTPSVGTLRVLVDGVPAGLSPGQLLTVTVGEHALQIQAPGYQEERRKLSVKSGEQQTLLVALRPMPTWDGGPRGEAPHPAAPSSAQMTAQSDSTLWSSPWLWTGAGLIVAGGVVAVVLLASGSSEESSTPIAGDIGGVIQTLRGR